VKGKNAFSQWCHGAEKKEKKKAKQCSKLQRADEHSQKETGLREGLQ
jgi:hypothetical protein